MPSYVYLSDGTKVSATNASGDGLVYLGSFTYKKTGDNLALESIPFGGGRFVATATSLEPHFFMRDHLGSVRVVVDGDGKELEYNDYYPLGMRWNGGQLSDNLYRYNGKEEQGFLNLPYLDYGARMYDPRRGGWLTSDPLLENHPEHGPYVFCGDNPIRFVDPNGMDYYQSAGGAVTWQDNNALRLIINDEVYKNIGAAYSQQLADGSYVNYYQDVYISSTDDAVDARQLVLANKALSGWLLSTDSPLKTMAQQDLMRSLIHNAQGNFIAGAAEFVASALQNGGDAVATAGYAASATGVGSGAGVTLIAMGNGMKYVGVGVGAAVDYLRGNTRKVGYTGFTTGVMYGIGEIPKLVPGPVGAKFNLLLTPFNMALDYGGSTIKPKNK